MALQKSQQLPSGVEAAYHRITSILLRIGDVAIIEVSSYLNEQSRRDGKAPVSTSAVRIAAVAEIANAPEGAMASAYAKLKESGALAQAQDI
jgi:hypothetical protein